MAGLCGECTECCYVLTVQSLDGELDLAEGGSKERDEWCSRCEAAVGCTVYEHPEKPVGCGAYRCQWLREGLEGDLRPDRSGVVFQRNPETGGLLGFVRASRMGDWRSGPVRALILAETAPVFIHCGQEHFAVNEAAKEVLRGARSEVEQVRAVALSALEAQGAPDAP